MKNESCNWEQQLVIFKAQKAPIKKYTALGTTLTVSRRSPAVHYRQKRINYDMSTHHYCYHFADCNERFSLANECSSGMG